MSRFHSIVVAVALLALPASTAFAGGQGLGINGHANSVDASVRRHLMNPGDEAPARLVCVDAPSTECFDLTLDRPTTEDPTMLRSDDCPAGPAAQACRPDTIPGTDLVGRLEVDVDPIEDWVRTDVSASYPPSQCFFSNPQITSTIVPATYDRILDPALGTAIYVDDPFNQLTDFPAHFTCAHHWVRTAAADLGSTASTHMTIVTNSSTWIWIAYQSGATPPSWLTADFTSTGDEVETTRFGFSVSFDLWRSNKIYAPGETVALGGNHAGGGNASRMYLVIGHPPDQIELCGSYTASISYDMPTGLVPVSTVSETSCYVQDGPDSIFTTPPLLLGGGLGYMAQGAASVFRCHTELAFGESLEYERSFAEPGFIDRTAMIDVAQTLLPQELCDSGAGPICSLRPAVTMIEADGTLSGGTSVGGSDSECSFPVRFTEPGETRVVLHGPSQADIDTLIPTVVTAETGDSESNWVGERGVVTEVAVQTSIGLFFGDQVRTELRRGAFTAALDDRNACSTLVSQTNVTYADASPNPPPSACGTMVGTRRPADSLAGLVNEAVTGDWELALQDLTAPGNDNDLSAWQVRIRTLITACSDGIDNDGDGTIDWDGGPQGTGLPDANCTTARTNRESASSGYGCGLGPELAVLLAGLGLVRGRSKRSGPVASDAH